MPNAVTSIQATGLGSSSLIIVGVIALFAVLALALGLLFRSQVLSADAGSPKMREIAAAVEEGAKAYLTRQFRTLALFVLLVCALLFLLPGDGGLRTGRSIAFIIGAVFSAVIGSVGMRLAVKANVRVAAAAGKADGYATGAKVAFRTGGTVGLFTVGLGLLGATSTVLIFKAEAPGVLEGFGFGAALLAMFMRVGGGIFTKAADVGADLVGKVEQGIPEDDARNPATIADNVGDNVGDCAGMAADLFESYAVTLVASLILGKAAFGEQGLVFPLLIASIGILTASLGVYLTKMRKGENGLKAINRGFYLSAVIGAVLSIIASYLYLPSSFADFDFTSVGGASPYYFDAAGVRTLFVDGDPRLLSSVAVLIGIILAGIILWLTGYFTGTDKEPTLKVARTSRTGAATVVLSGIGLGLESAVYTAIAIGGALFALFALAGGLISLGLFFIAVAGCGLLTTVGVIVAMDTFGPVSDNAQGIAEMSGEASPEAAEILTNLDAVGNTTKAITKGIAIATAVLAAAALFGSYTDALNKSLTDVGASAVSAASVMVQGSLRDFTVFNPANLFGLILGGAVVFLFAGLATDAVTRAAGSIVFEVRRQFRENPGIMTHETKPNYAACVDICTRDSLRELVAPGLLAALAPIVVGFGLGPGPLAAFLAGSIITGVLMAVFLSNAGGAWDNAKKIVEDGAYGGKGSDAHAATVIGDTVGDPFKDTAGPAINPLIKVMNLVALLIVPSVVTLSVGDNQNTGVRVLIAIAAAIAIIGFLLFSKLRRSNMDDDFESEDNADQEIEGGGDPSVALISVENDPSTSASVGTNPRDIFANDSTRHGKVDSQTPVFETSDAPTSSFVAHSQNAGAEVPASASSSYGNSTTSYGAVSGHPYGAEASSTDTYAPVTDHSADQAAGSYNDAAEVTEADVAAARNGSLDGHSADTGLAADSGLDADSHAVSEASDPYHLGGTPAAHDDAFGVESPEAGAVDEAAFDVDSSTSPYGSQYAGPTAAGADSVAGSDTVTGSGAYDAEAADEDRAEAEWTHADGAGASESSTAAHASDAEWVDSGARADDEWSSAGGSTDTLSSTDVDASTGTDGGAGTHAAEVSSGSEDSSEAVDPLAASGTFGDGAADHAQFAASSDAGSSDTAASSDAAADAGLTGASVAAVAGAGAVAAVSAGSSAERSSAQGADSSLPLSNGAAPAGFSIKGNADSMKYHTSDSPSYKQTKAEIWFRTEEAAIAAGYVNAFPGRKAAVAAGDSAGAHVAPAAGLVATDEARSVGDKSAADNAAPSVDADSTSTDAKSADAASLSGSTAGEAQAEDAKVASGEAVVVGPHGPDSALPLSNGDAPRGFVVKGNADSMKYHTSDSPSYKQTKAEVWFRTEEAAISAGYVAGFGAKKPGGNAPQASHETTSSTAGQATTVPLASSASPLATTATSDASGAGAGSSASHSKGKSDKAPQEGPYGPDSALPLAKGAAPEGFVIKGNADSMKYHTTSSPSFKETKAEVWFRTEDAAIAAGFVNAFGKKSSASHGAGKSDHQAADKSTSALADTPADASADKLTVGHPDLTDSSTNAVTTSAPASAAAVASSSTATKPAAFAASSSEANGASSAADVAPKDSDVAGGSDEPVVEGPHGPDSALPLTSGKAPAGFDIKGNADSMKFHNTDSPYYKRTKAEVWFRTEAAALAAGYSNAGGSRGFTFEPGPYPNSALPAADGSGPSDYPVKGNVDSMKYHGPDSPWYARTKAEVWFKDEASAREAGFKKPGE